MEDKTKKELKKEKRNIIVSLIEEIEKSIKTADFDEETKNTILHLLFNLKIITKKYNEVVRIAEIISYYNLNEENLVKYKNILKGYLSKIY